MIYAYIGMYLLGKEPPKWLEYLAKYSTDKKARHLHYMIASGDRRSVELKGLVLAALWN